MSTQRKEARAKRVFTSVCERHDKIREQREELRQHREMLDFGVWIKRKHERSEYLLPCANGTTKSESSAKSCGSIEDAGFWSLNKKEARVKQVFTSVCERHDKCINIK